MDHSFLRQHIIYKCVIGSRAYGLQTDLSDTDLSGVFVPPARLHWSLDGVPEQIEWDESQECYWEIGKFVRLALKANPSALEILWSPIILESTPLGDELLSIREAFLSKLLYKTYREYADAQLRKLTESPYIKTSTRNKLAMHLIRLQLSGITALAEGQIALDMTEHRETLLAIRAGETDWDEMLALHRKLGSKLDESYGQTRLPDHPDFERANAFLIHVRRSAIDW